MRAATIEEAYEAAATFASDPTTSERVELAVVTTAGGWGVVTADAISGARAPGPSVHLHRGGGSGNE